jgi:hypothetical protein
MSGIDYSKWDHLDEYSDDEDEQQDQGSSPQVTQLDAPSRVTFGGGSAEITAQSTAPNTSSPSAMAVQKLSKPTSINTSACIYKDDNDTSKKWTQNGGLVTTETGHKLYWSQDRYAVTFRLALDDHVKAKDLKVHVEGMLPYSDRNHAVGSTKPVLQIMILPTTSPTTAAIATATATPLLQGDLPILPTTSPTTAAIATATATPLLQGDLPHPVHWAQEDEEEKIMDWSIERCSGSTNFLVFSLRKAVPMQGMFVWWRRPLLSFPEVDVPAASSTNTTSQEFSNAWEEAHKLFREKRASQPPQEEIP